jgi:CHAT domain-containing protein
LQQRDHDRWSRPAARLAEVLLEPVRREGWLEGVEHLYLVPHGMLNYLPFALLPYGPDAGADLLIERFSVSYLPTAALLSGREKQLSMPRSMLALAQARSRLRHAPQEADLLANLFSPHATSLTGLAATETAFREQAAGYQLLHLATHGYFNKLNPLLSGLELEADADNDGLLEVHEILELRLNSELITLSACQTGMGSGFFAEIPAGDDFVGLTRAFLQAGSDSVLATLWEVNDRTTVDLMESFYMRLEESGANGDKAVALADAQRALRASEHFRHPYYWAPFVLVGPLHDRNGVRG